MSVQLETFPFSRAQGTHFIWDCDRRITTIRDMPMPLLLQSLHAATGNGLASGFTVGLVRTRKDVREEPIFGTSEDDVVMPKDTCSRRDR